MGTKPKSVLVFILAITLILSLCFADSVSANDGEETPEWQVECAKDDPDDPCPAWTACACQLLYQLASCCPEDDPDLLWDPLGWCYYYCEDEAKMYWEAFVACCEQACDTCCQQQGFPGGELAEHIRPDVGGFYCNCAEKPETPKEEPKPTFNPEIELDPSEGPPETEVFVSGEDFPLDEEVEIRWGSEDGELLATTMSDGEGSFSTSFVVPKDAEEGEHYVYAVFHYSPQRGWARAPFNILILCIYGSVKAGLRGGLPLQGVEVELITLDPADPFNEIRLRDVITGRLVVLTDEQGRYRICNPLIRVPMENSILRVTLRESQFGTYTVFDEMADKRVVQAFFGMHGEIGADLNNINTWFVIETAGDLEKNLWFEDLDDHPATEFVREDHALDAALIYYHTHQAMRFYRTLGAPFRNIPVAVVTYSQEPTSCGGDEIFINEEDSDWNSGNAPKNREWHEFSHYIMWDVYGRRFPPDHFELEDDFNGNGVIDWDINHGGYWGNWLSSSDAITEGFAEFMAMVIADQMNQQGEIYMQDHLKPYIYTIGIAFPQMLNLEINHPQTYIPYVPAILSGLKIPDEELSVASTLWDFYDGSDGGDRDHISLPIQGLWPILSGTYRFPQYYDGEGITRFMGDPFTYAGRWFRDGYTGERNLTRNLQYPRVNRSIWYIKDLYDALNWSLPAQDREIDEIFSSHSIYLDTFHIYEDYSTLAMDDITTFRDEASKIDLSISSEAAHEFWGRGIVADLEVSGWGAGFTIDKHPYFDTRDYLYLLIWVNAPNGTTFDIVVEDYNGQWLCSGTSEAVIGVTETPIDMTFFQRGTGHWGAYSPPGMSGGPYPFIVVLSSSAAAEELKYVYEFRPNIHHETPPAGTSGPDPKMIEGIGVLFTTPGSYKAMVGAVVLTLDYPWVMDMRSIKGIGDQAQGRWRPYRRDLPPLDGSEALIHVNEAPATLMVSLNYTPPYEELSFTYPLNITEKSQEIWLYIEPSFQGGENTISMVAIKEGFEPSQPFTMTSTQYWDNLGKEEYVVEASLNLTPKRRPIDLMWILVVGVVSVLVAVGATVYVRRRRKEGMLMTCPSCGVPIEPDQVYCGGCGMEVKETGHPTTTAPGKQGYCTKCGAKLVPQARFCPKCGEKVE